MKKDKQGVNPPTIQPKPTIRVYGQDAERTQTNPTRLSKHKYLFTLTVPSLPPDRPAIYERCVFTSTGDYLGIETGAVYSKDWYRHVPVYFGKITKLYHTNCTGKLHLDGDAGFKLREKFVGKEVHLENSHFCSYPRNGKYSNQIVYRAYLHDGSMEWFTHEELEIGEQLA